MHLQCLAALEIVVVVVTIVVAGVETAGIAVGVETELLGILQAHVHVQPPQ